MSQCKVYLENYSGCYYAGSQIRGRLECHFQEEVTFRAIKIRIICKENNSWSGTETYTDSQDNNATKTRTITLTGENNVLYAEQKLYDAGSGTRTLNRGHHVYPFTYNLPHDIPSSFSGPHGSIIYEAVAVVDRPMRFDYEDKFIFVVHSPIDFNHMSRDLQRPSSYSDDKTVCCWCCQGGNLSMEIQFPKTVFIPGENVPFTIRITNMSNSNVDNVVVEFTKKTKYFVTQPRHEDKIDVDRITSFREHGVGAHGEHTFNVKLNIPQHITVPNFTKCKLFKVEYEFKATAEVGGCSMDLDVVAWDLKLGHVQVAPVGGYQEEASPGEYQEEGEWEDVGEEEEVREKGPRFNPPYSGGSAAPSAPPAGFTVPPSGGGPSAPYPSAPYGGKGAESYAPQYPSNPIPEMPPPSYTEAQNMNKQ